MLAERAEKQVAVVTGVCEGPQSHSKQALIANSHLLAEKYTDCTFLFAKIGGLAALVNNPTQRPRRVLRDLEGQVKRARGPLTGRWCPTEDMKESSSALAEAVLSGERRPSLPAAK